ncbi:DUF4255 domain-containing protein [Georgenia subflava]|uniref:DUF4255 domain-containing protein n=1 Tax=Georgenia subflava TaxID=1622177 RepID=A0A6N7EGY9_9MICO|nr:DUF4255 domain-containing protein [Georgenia subflava]MPV37310.1 DUF4255 domain-containing protein [Georgenia subflava]
MSNSLAIAAVTSTLRYVIDRSLSGGAAPVGGARVTTLRPDRIADLTAGDTPTPGLNLFCFQLTPNHAWNLSDLPTRHTDGSLARRPVAALDLHYLLTGYGAEPTLDAQRLLARAVLALAVTPVLTRAVVTEALDLYAADDGMDFLAAADLADQLDLVKLSPDPLSLEEVSKLWGVVGSHYELSAAYVASVVLLEADVVPTTALPVRSRHVVVSAAGPPRIAEVATVPAGGAVVTGTELVVSGTGLLGPATEVRVGAAVLDPADGATAQRIGVTVTADVPCGVHSLRVRHRAAPDGAGGPQRVLATSGAVPLMVRPTVTVSPPEPGAELAVGLVPAVQAGQRAVVTLRRLSGGDPQDPSYRSVDFPPAPPGSPPRDTLLVDPADVGPGRWLVRVAVDGVESLPELDGDTYGSPSVELP